MFDEQIFTLDEVSKYLRVPLEAVQQEVTSGKLRAINIAGYLRVREFDLAKYKNDSYAAVPSLNGSVLPTDGVEMSLKEAPDFRHLWPDGKDENFVNVSEGIASLGGKEYRVKVGFTLRKSSGQLRSRSLVLVDRYPTVEFVAASERARPEEKMASIIRDRNGKQLPVGATLPAEYAGMIVGPYREVVTGPGAANGLAVICEAKDIISMVKHALIRYKFREERA